jgi:hypothetical protein
MDHWPYEFYIKINEDNRTRMMAEIRAERIAREDRVYHPGMSALAMFRLANWMIVIGKGLQRRYEIPPNHCSQTTSSNIAK